MHCRNRMHYHLHHLCTLSVCGGSCPHYHFPSPRHLAPPIRHIHFAKKRGNICAVSWLLLLHQGWYRNEGQSSPRPIYLRVCEGFLRFRAFLAGAWWLLYLSDIPVSAYWWNYQHAEEILREFKRRKEEAAGYLWDDEKLLGYRLIDNPRRWEGVQS